jgi:exopolysaccharide production protein ExoZ
VAYLSVVAVSTAMGWMPLAWRDVGLGLVFANLLPIEAKNYLFVSWSLAYELAFYALLPLLLACSKWLGLQRLAVVWVVAGWVLVGWVWPHMASLRAFGLLVGLWLGGFTDAQLRAAAGRIALIPLAVAYLALHLVPPFFHLDNTPTYYAALWVVLALAITAIVFGNNPLNRLFSLPWLRAGGTISYSLYLWHTLCLSLVSEVLLHRWWPIDDPYGRAGAVLCMGLLLSLAVSRLSYELIERRYFDKQPKGA